MPKAMRTIISTIKSGTLIKRCVCTHAFQDKRYGAGNRVHNIMKNGNARCTVCGRVER